MSAKYIQLIVWSVLFYTACNSQSPDIMLQSKNWNDQVKQNLEKQISVHANQNKIAIFDFDNTLICRDIGEATLATLSRDAKVRLDSRLESISPAFQNEDELITVKSAGIMPYYEALLKATVHQQDDRSAYSNAYAWAAQCMQGFAPSLIVKYTEKAYASGIAITDFQNGTLTEVNGYLQPFFYPEMVDLIGNLLKNGYQVFVVSASNVWTVRFMVTNYLNSLLADDFGLDCTIRPENVFGINMLLRDERNTLLYKDRHLVMNNPKYAQSDFSELAKYTLTNQMVSPATAYWGKTATILEHISSEAVFLIAGDSPNDLPMMTLAENVLWLARHENESYQEAVAEFASKHTQINIMYQPVRTKKTPGFYAGGDVLSSDSEN